MKLLLLSFVCLTVSSLVLTQCGEPDPEENRQPPEPLLHPEPPEQEYTPGTFQSDMYLTDGQVNDLVDSARQMKLFNVFKRRAVRSERWPNGIIPYLIDDNFSDDFVATIKKAMEWWTTETCVTFIEYNDTVPDLLGHEHRVLFKKADGGCTAWVGMIGRYPQTIDLSETKCKSTGTIAHEIGHAVGWYHEQARPDRGDYVTIRLENVKDGFENQFTPHEVDTYGVAYDAGSIMHYGSSYFSKNNQLTIEPNNPLDLFKMGNRKEFTFYDKKLGNLMYDCSSECKTDLQCDNGGYVGKDCKCHCKVHYNGIRCEVYTQGDESADCMNELPALEEVNTINSPGYPNAYGAGLKCAWLLTAPSERTITLIFTDFDVEQSKSGACYDSVVVRRGPYILGGGDKHCGVVTPPQIVSDGNQIMVILSTDSVQNRKGFIADYYITPETVGTTLPPASTTSLVTEQSSTTKITEKPCEDVEGACGGGFTTSGCFASPNYGHGAYNNDETCVYHLKVDDGERVELKIVNLDIEDQETCLWDQLVVTPGSTTGSLRMCGEYPPIGSFVSIDSTMTVKLISDGAVGKGGFAASFKGITVD